MTDEQRKACAWRKRELWAIFVFIFVVGMGTGYGTKIAIDEIKAYSQRCGL